MVSASAVTCCRLRVPSFRSLDHLGTVYEDRVHPLAQPPTGELEVRRCDAERHVVHPVEVIAGLEDEATGPDGHRDLFALRMDRQLQHIPVEVGCLVKAVDSDRHLTDLHNSHLLLNCLRQANHAHGSYER